MHAGDVAPYVPLSLSCLKMQGTRGQATAGAGTVAEVSNIVNTFVKIRIGWLELNRENDNIINII